VTADGEPTFVVDDDVQVLLIGVSGDLAEALARGKWKTKRLGGWCGTTQCGDGRTQEGRGTGPAWQGNLHRRM
jgi:hypothetical protein